MVPAEEIAAPIWSSILAVGFLLAVVCPVEKLNVLFSMYIIIWIFREFL